jgi:hypothetical protein
MTVHAPVRRPPVAARRVGYVIAAALTAAFWFLVNMSPGWEAVPFLTEDTTKVVTLVNVSLVVSVVANLLYLAFDPPSWRALGDVVTTGVGLAVLIRIWQVFPFRFTGSFDWSLPVRVLLFVGIAGSIVGIVVNVAAYFRSFRYPTEPGTGGRSQS